MFQYLKAVGWFTLSLVVSCGNDALTKYLSHHIHPWEITFFRFFLGSFLLLPLMVYQGRQAFQTRRPGLHLARGIIIFMAICLWSQGIQTAPITTATIMSFTVPIFVLLLAPILLKEVVRWPLWVATLTGFAGIVLVLEPKMQQLEPRALYFVFAALLFGLLDIMNKKYVVKEPTLCMLFYATLVATLLMILPTAYVWSMPSRHEWLCLGMLGVGSNLILYFLLRAFALADASSLASFRYLELFLSIGVGYVLFEELPSSYSYVLGTGIIIPSTMFVGYYQARYRA
ncbi:MAG: DMT family transporter [Bacteroidota bacterium]